LQGLNIAAVEILSAEIGLAKNIITRAYSFYFGTACQESYLTVQHPAAEKTFKRKDPALRQYRLTVVKKD